MKQKRISIDNEICCCLTLRKNINDFNNINDLILKIKSIQFIANIEYETKKENFLFFLEELKNQTYHKQKNNHHFMRTFLSEEEKIKDYKRIKYSNLEENLKKGEVRYEANIAPKKIMSNYFVSNKTELILEVDKLEKAFREFTRSDNIILDANHDDIIKYFALQFSRRESFLKNIIKLYASYIDKEIKEYDLLDYMICKYLYNITIILNYQNWLEDLKTDEPCIYQTQYLQLDLEKSNQPRYKDAKNIQNKNNTKLTNLAITEIHTFKVYDILFNFGLNNINETLILNELSPIEIEEISDLEKIYVTMGSRNKLCYLSKSYIKRELRDKVDFLIHVYWDEFMINAAMLNLLLKVDSPLNKLEYFEKIDKNILKEAKFMNEIFEISRKYENQIKF